MPKAVSNSAGAAQSSLITTVPYMQAPDHYRFGKAGFSGQNGEGRSGLDDRVLRQALKEQVTRPPARMLGAAPERVSPHRQKRTAEAR